MSLLGRGKMADDQRIRGSTPGRWRVAQAGPSYGGGQNHQDEGPKSYGGGTNQRTSLKLM